MSYTQAEKTVMGMIDLFHTYVKPDDMMDKAGLIKMLQDNFPTFLSACVSRGGCPPCAGPGVAEDALLVPWTGHSQSPSSLVTAARGPLGPHILACHRVAGHDECGRVWLGRCEEAARCPPEGPAPVPLPLGAWRPWAQAPTLEAPTGLLRPEAGDGHPW